MEKEVSESKWKDNYAVGVYILLSYILFKFVFDTPGSEVLLFILWFGGSVAILSAKRPWWLKILTVAILLSIIFYPILIPS